MTQPHPFDFFDRLQWLDGRPLMSTIEPYRRKIFERALYTFDADGAPHYDRVLCGRAKKNWKSSDLILAGLFRLLAWQSSAGNDCFILANDEGQAADDLSLAKKLIAANPIIDREVIIKTKEIVRRDGRGTMSVLPAGDAVGAHGKTYLFAGFDEIHGYRTYDLFEALSPDPTRRHVLTWITSYAGIRHAPGIPLYDFMQTGKAGDDLRLLFSWYGADYTTDPKFAGEGLTSEARANPSLKSWDNADYLPQQKKRLPAHKYRRLHLNLPGAPDGAAFSGEHVMAAIVTGRWQLAAELGQHYSAFVDMSGGSNDDAVLGIAHKSREDRLVLDVLVAQSGRPPFNPRDAVRKFAGMLHAYRCAQVSGDAYGGETFRRDFEQFGIAYEVSDRTKSELYEELDARLNAREVELLDVGSLQEQLLTLVWRGTRIDHQPSDHDDWANAAAGAIYLCGADEPLRIPPEALMLAKRRPARYGGRPMQCFF